MTKTSLTLTGPWVFREYPEHARRMTDLDTGHWLPARYPGSIVLSLAAAGLFRLRDLYASPEIFGWIFRQDWVFRTEFDYPGNPQDIQTHDLICEGLDTIVQLWLNDTLLGKANNAFIEHQFDAGRLLRPGRNRLTIKVAAPREYAEQQMARNGLPVIPAFGDPCRVFIRKAQCQFGSAMGPVMLDGGITGPIRLESFPLAKIESLYVRTIDCNCNYADICIAISIRKPDSEKTRPIHCKLTLDGGGKSLTHTLDFSSQTKLSTVIRVDHPALWNPRGYGNPHLYSLKAELYNDQTLLDQNTLAFGIRSIRVIRDRDGQAGGLNFEVNQQPIGIKGLIWLPAGLMHASDQTHIKEQLLRRLVNTNINMIRIWGGGKYEEDSFYRLCDSLGILVWQDFMFASACYPEQDWFMDAIRRESISIVQRLRNHPCLALWCGNSHIDRLHRDGLLGKSKKYSGRNIFHHLLPDILSDLDPDREYLPTAPDAQHGQKTNFTEDLWDTWNTYAPIDSAIPDIIPSFVCETGFQSMSDAETIQLICLEDDLNRNESAIDKHNYHAQGPQRLIRFAAEYFRPARSVEDQIYQSQVTQARAIKYQAENLRSNGQRNRGVVLWSANDFWPATAFSMIDYTGKAKALFYYARRFFAPFLICLTRIEGPGSLQNQKRISIVNDTAHPLIALACIRLMDMKGTVLDQSHTPISLEAFSQTSIVPPRELILPVSPENCFLHMALINQEVVLAENTHLFLSDKYIHYRPLDIDIQIERQSTSRLCVQLQSRYFIKDCCIQMDGSPVLSDNFIDLLPGKNYLLAADFDHPAPPLNKPLVIRSAGH